MPDPADLNEDDAELRDLVDQVEDDELGYPAPVPAGRTTGDSTFPCPYCGEKNDLFLEPVPDRLVQEFAEECETCGRMYAVTVAYDDVGEPSIHAERPD